MEWMWLDLLPTCLLAMLIGVVLGCFFRHAGGAFAASFAATHVAANVLHAILGPAYFDETFCAGSS